MTLFPHQSVLDATPRLRHLYHLAQAIRTAVMASQRSASYESAAEVADERGGDTIYQIDTHGEAALLAYCATWGDEEPFLLVAEGIEGEGMIFPAGATRADVRFTLIIDPIDGTRGLMYGKRSAWVLLGIAPPPALDQWPTIADITLALQAELPTPRAALADVLFAIKGTGVWAETHDLRSGTITTFTPRPSQSATLAHGFATIVKFFPGAKATVARIEERLFFDLLGPPPNESPQVFDDEYISSGGQLYELMSGHDRFIADLRPIVHDEVPRLCSHPYDLCTLLIAREAGVIVTSLDGGPITAPLDTSTSVGWVGYANAALHQAIEPVLQRILREEGLLQ